MGTYRMTRNIEASIIDYITDELVGDWTGVNVEKTYTRVYKIDLPTICVRCGPTSHDKAEIGDGATARRPLIWIDIFAQDDGQRLDLKDWLIEKLKHGLTYYEYEVSGNQVTNKTANGRLRVIRIEDTGINYDIAKDDLNVHDRYRHLITLEVSLGRVES